MTTGAFFTDFFNHAKRKLGGSPDPDKGQLGVAPSHGMHDPRHYHRNPHRPITSAAGLFDRVAQAPAAVLRTVQPGTAVAGLTGWMLGGAVGAVLIGGGYYLYKRHQQAACPTDDEMRSIFSDIDLGKMTPDQGTALALALDKQGCALQSAAVAAAVRVKTGGPPRIKPKLGSTDQPLPKFFVLNPQCQDEVNGLPDDPRPNPLGPIFGAPLPGMRTSVMTAIDDLDVDALRKLADLVAAGGTTRLADCLRGYATMIETKKDVTIFVPSSSTVLDPSAIATAGLTTREEEQARKNRIPPWLGGNPDKPCGVCPIQKQPDFVRDESADAEQMSKMPPMFRRQAH
jgi:hypothetical protein